MLTKSERKIQLIGLFTLQRKKTSDITLPSPLNGCSEKDNRTVVDTARILILEKVYLSAYCLLDKTRISEAENKTPYEV